MSQAEWKHAGYPQALKEKSAANWAAAMALRAAICGGLQDIRRVEYCPIGSRAYYALFELALSLLADGNFCPKAIRSQFARNRNYKRKSNQYDHDTVPKACIDPGYLGDNGLGVTLFELQGLRREADYKRPHINGKTTQDLLDKAEDLLRKYQVIP